MLLLTGVMAVAEIFGLRTHDTSRLIAGLLLLAVRSISLTLHVLSCFRL